MRTAIRLLLLLASRFHTPGPGDYLLDENRNYLVDENGDRLIG